MSQRIPVTIFVTLPVVGLFLAAAGCNDPTITRDTGAYRTVTAEPLRDTSAARRHHQKGLKHLEDNELDSAIEDIQRALKADVAFGPAHNSLGRAYFLKGRDYYYEAAWEFEYAHKHLPKAPEPLNNLGLIHEAEKSFDRAIEYYRRAIDLEPENIHLRANLARAMIRRGDRTQEVRDLLEQVLDEDDRPDWLIWAKRWATRIDPEP